MRIASLLASATEIVCALGLEDRLVAISHECDHPPSVLHLPRLSRARFDPGALSAGAIDAAVRDTMQRYGSPYALDETALTAARPDLILTQAVCEVCAVPTTLAAAAAESLGGTARVISVDAHSLEEVLESIERLGEELGVPQRGRELAAGLRQRLALVRGRVAGRPRPSVMAVEWLDPAFVPGHWVPEMIERAGGRNLVGEPHRPSRQVAWADLEGLDPDALVIMPCGFGLERSWAAAAEHAERLEAIASRAIAAGRAWVVDGSAYFNRSGPRVVDGVEILAALFHPDRAGGVSLDGRAKVWRGR